MDKGKSSFHIEYEDVDGGGGGGRGLKFCVCARGLLKNGQVKGRA